ncbi:MAG: type 4a pilus biogenesis protein PilO [Candidatus Omnitrophota bacterium]
MKTPSNEELFQFFRNIKNNPKAIIGIAVCLFFLDAVFLLRGQLSQIGRSIVEARKLKTEYQTASTDIKFAPTYEKRLEDLSVEQAVLESQIPSEGSMPALLEAISKFADVSSVKILRISPVSDPQALLKALTVKGKNGEERIFRQKISLTARSGFHQLGRFVALLENAPQFFDIRSVEIRTDEQDFVRQIITMIVEVVVRKG